MNNSNRRIIVIDDNENIFKDFQEILTNSQDTSELEALEAEFYGDSPVSKKSHTEYDLVYANQGKTGVEKIETALKENKPFSVAFVDMRMPPGWDGIETIKHIWEIDHEIQIVICTAYSDYSLSEITSQIGNPDKLLILKKPFEPEEVAQLANALSEKWLLAKQAAVKLNEIEAIVKEKTKKLATANMFLKQEIDSRKHLAKALKESEQKYKKLFDKASDGIFIVQQNHVKFANESALNIVQYSLEEITNKNVEELIYTEDLNETREWYTRIFTKKNKSEFHTYRIVNKKGEIVWIQATALVVAWDGKSAILNFIRNITKLRKLEAQLVQAQKMDAIGVLAGGIAHDFNNILSVIIGYTELLLINTKDNNDLNQKTERILSASHRARDLVSQILTFSRQQEQKKEPVQVTYIAKEALKFLRATIASSIEFKIDINTNTGMIIAEPTKIHQVIMNICVNAAQAMQNKGGTLGVTIKNLLIDSDSKDLYPGLEQGAYIQIIISDTGEGIDESIIGKIFNPYFTTKKQGEGTGMGLSVVHGIVTDLGGRISVESGAGTGTTFHLYIPKISILNTEDEADEAPAPGGNESILIVDDEDYILDILEELLSEKGYTITTTSNSLEAFRIFNENKHTFDLVITDQTMPNMTGLELVEKIRDIMPEIPVILCSGFSSSINKEQAGKIGINAFIDKPVYQHELTKTIRNVLDTCSDKPE